METDGVFEAEKRLFEQNKIEEVEELLINAVSIAAEEQDGQAILRLLNELLGYYSGCRRYEDAFKVADEILSVAERVLPDNSPMYAALLLNIASAYCAGGRLEETGKIYHIVERIYSELIPDDDMAYARLYNDEALLCQKKKDYILANEYLARAHEIEAAHGKKSGPVAVVTGASRGIGKAIAEKFASEGYDLVITCSSSEDELEAAAAKIREKYGVNCIARVADGADPAKMSAVFEGLDHLDVLVNNAGISYIGLLHEMTYEDWRRICGANLDSVFIASRQAIPYFLQKHAGRIINISSVWGNVGASMEVAYSATKGGVNSFTKALAKELAPSGISVNAVACGLIDTSMNACFSGEELEGVISEIPADRIGKPEEVAELAYRLATGPDYVTGQIVTIDGGWT